MQFMAKFIALVLILNGVALSFMLFYRSTTTPFLIQRLAVDTDCGLHCWFGFSTDNTVDRDTIIDNITSNDGRVANNHATHMSFVLPDGHDGRLSVTLNNGNATSACYFPRSGTILLGDALAAFGAPNIFGQYDNRRFHARYSDARITLTGAFDRNRVYALAPRLTYNIAITEICVSRYDFMTIIDDAFQGESIPIWRGINAPLTYYDIDENQNIFFSSSGMSSVN